MSNTALIDQIIDEHERQPVDILGVGDTGEHHYLRYHRDGFVRTIDDIAQWCDAHPRSDGQPLRILEIGPFLGPVSVGLKRLGYDVEAIDIPEFADSPSLQQYFQRQGVRLQGVNLRHRQLPFADEHFDVVLICEVIEHLNFNPLPVLQAINRVMRPGGLLYIGMPNHASIRNRIRVLTGRSLHNPIEDFFRQLDRTQNMLVGLHWREYTMAETHELLERMGFRRTRSYYFYEQTRTAKKPLKRLVKALLFAYPPFRPYQVVLSEKDRPSTYDFWVTEATD